MTKDAQRRRRPSWRSRWKRLQWQFPLIDTPEPLVGSEEGCRAFISRESGDAFILVVLDIGRVHRAMAGAKDHHPPGAGIDHSREDDATAFRRPKAEGS